MHDLAIRDALILDGLGSPPFHSDLAVKDGRIAEIGKSLSGKEVLDASGLALMPGIIDNHTHYDAQITWDPLVSPSPALGEKLDTVFNAMLLNSDEQAVGAMLRHPASLVSLSDAGAHLTFFNDAGFGLHLLGHWVRERGALMLEDAVRRLTSAPAQLFGIRGRGALRPGYAADLMLFDPAAVGRGAKQRVFDLPGGHPRLTTPAQGMHGVWVNGVRDLGTLPGRMLREFST